MFSFLFFSFYFIYALGFPYCTCGRSVFVNDINITTNKTETPQKIGLFNTFFIFYFFIK
jgi:hypothetical protein